MRAFDPEQVARALEPFDDAPRVWVAYSGGLDSGCLLHAAACVRERLPGLLAALHIDHGLHADSGRWAEHCRTQCQALGVSLVTRSLGLTPSPGESVEAVAREARYRAFAGLLAPGDLLLAAHHQDDQAETLLLALLRGAGVHGLAAMPFVAPLGQGRLVRPLLGTPRAALEDYAAALGLSWVEDPSNASQGLDRNYLRHGVLPLIHARWPAVSRTLARTAGHCAEAAALADQLAASALHEIEGGRPGTLSIPGLAALDPALRKAVVRLWLRRLGFRTPDSAHLGRILGEVLTARPDADPLVAWQGCEVRRYRSDLFALRPLPSVPGRALLPWTGDRLDLPAPLGVLERRTDGPRGTPRHLNVRLGATGLACRYRQGGHTKPLKQCFQELGIPPWIRPYLPLVLAGEQLIWVGGIGPCLGERQPVEERIDWRGHPWESAGLFRWDHLDEGRA